MSFNFEKLLRGSQLGGSSVTVWLVSLSNFIQLTTPSDAMDTSETIYIAPLALIKMARHAKQGIPLEIMGLMLGSIVDDYKIQVVDVFWMPQQATGINVESIDPVFQTEIMRMLSATGRKESVVGWYHSHPGFGCWLSSTDVQTAQVFEKQLSRSVSVVIDPVQSVKGKIVIEAFRTTGERNSAAIFGAYEVRQTTSNECIRSPKASYASLVSNPTRYYYNLNICFDISPEENRILSLLDKSEWPNVRDLPDETKHVEQNDEVIRKLLEFSKPYKTTIDNEVENIEEITKEKVGKVDAKSAINASVNEVINKNFRQSVTMLINRLSTL